MYNSEKEHWDRLGYQNPELQSVNDISWSLMNGRSYHMLAYSTKQNVKILYFKVN